MNRGGGRGGAFGGGAYNYGGQERGGFNNNSDDRDALPGFEFRWRNRRIYPPPITPCTDPLKFPFPKLQQRNESGSMSLDEELLRAIIGQFTVQAVGCLPFKEIYEKLKKDNAHLTWYLYDDPDYVWSYIRCYPEHFQVDKDPRCPEHVWYTAKCKVVAKTDRRKYERELVNIRPVIDTCSDDEWNRMAYDADLEKKSLQYLCAIFVQLEKKFPDGNRSNLQLPMSFIEQTLKTQTTIPPEIQDYIRHVDQFMSRRVHVFNVFGFQVTLRPMTYVDVVRRLTERLQANGGIDDPKRAYEYFVASPNLGQVAIRTIGHDPEKFQQDDFVLFIHQQKFLFRLRPRRGTVELRHGVCPVITAQEVCNMADYQLIQRLKTVDELTGGMYSTNAGPDSEIGFPCGSPTPEPSFYTMRWLSQNFESMSIPSGSSDDTYPDDEEIIVDPLERPHPIPSLSKENGKGKGKMNNAKKAKPKSKGWPALGDYSHSTTTGSSASSKKAYPPDWHAVGDELDEPY